MSIIVEMPDQEIAALKRLTHHDNDAAVIAAAREFLRVSRLRELKGVSGKVEFEDNWRELENLELNGSLFPR